MKISKFIIFFVAFFTGWTILNISTYLLSDASSFETDSGQIRNFETDLKKAKSYDYHEDLARDYIKTGQYDKAIEEYKTAINIIETSPDDFTRTDVSKEFRDNVNFELKASSQIFSRYGLIGALEKAGQYTEALQNVDWLMKNQIMKGKEEFLKKRLEGMKQSLLQKMKQRDST